MHRAVQSKVGFAKQTGESTPSGRNPPTMIDVTLSDGTHRKVPYGRIELGLFGEGSFVDMQYDKNKQLLLINGECQKRYQSDLDKIIDTATRILATDSIYRGQAIKFVRASEPMFINLDHIDGQDIYLTSAAKFATMPIEARIEKTEECLKNKIDLKFGAILEGDYGTGKTLYAFKLAAKAVRNGWTFIYAENSEDTLEAMRMSHRYCKNGKGVVLFIEDIDRVLDKRDATTNAISVLMDGGESKNANIITIFTTNHIKKIDPTFLRGKRVGSIITLTHPDKATAQKMLERTLVDENGESVMKGSLENPAEKIVEYKIVPAFIAEIVERVKAHRIFSGNAFVNTQDVTDAIDSYQHQMDIAKLKEDSPSDADVLAGALRKIINPHAEETKVLLEDLRNQ